MLEVIGAALSEAVRNIRAAEDYNARDAVRLMAILRGALRSFLLYQLDTGAMKYIRSGYNSQADYRTFRSIPFTYSKA
jgi:hypothetical protein